MYKCTLCNSEIMSREHVCGMKDRPQRVDIASGGGWGRIDLGGRVELER